MKSEDVGLQPMTRELMHELYRNFSFDPSIFMDMTLYEQNKNYVYDPEKVTYEKLLSIYFANVDPFDSEGQFIDKGFSYTLAIFYNDEAEKELAEKKIKEIENSAGKETFVTLLPFKNFYEAEDYHQDYYLKNPEAFEKELIESGRKKEEA